MPKEVHDCAKALERKGYTAEEAWAICNGRYQKKDRRRKKRELKRRLLEMDEDLDEIRDEITKY